MQMMVESQLSEGSEVLVERFNREGYLLIRGGLDMEAVGRLQDYWAKSLADCGYIERGDSTFTAKHVVKKDHRNGGYKFPVDDKGIWRTLSQSPKVNEFMEQVFGEPVSWIPLYGYRAQQPNEDIPESRFAFWHSDQHYNPGIRVLTAWVPLTEIDLEMGGLSLIPRVHDKESLDEPFRIVQEPEVISVMRQDQPILTEEYAVTSTFSPGDVVLFDGRCPHSGLLNLTNKFRVSLDLRFQMASDRYPLIGKITKIEGDTVTVEDHRDGHLETVAIHEETLVRENSYRLPSKDFAQYIPVGTEVLMSRENGVAQLMTHLVPTEGRMYII
jgi:hypothetical protein